MDMIDTAIDPTTTPTTIKVMFAFDGPAEVEFVTACVGNGFDVANAVEMVTDVVYPTNPAFIIDVVVVGVEEVVELVLDCVPTLAVKVLVGELLETELEDEEAISGQVG